MLYEAVKYILSERCVSSNFGIGRRAIKWYSGPEVKMVQDFKSSCIWHTMHDLDTLQDLEVYFLDPANLQCEHNCKYFTGP